MKKNLFSFLVFAVFLLALADISIVIAHHHYQPPISPSEDLKQYINPGKLGVNYYFNPKLVDRGYVLKAGDQCCVGDTVSVEKSTFSGEWFRKGGPKDTPPVLWVDDLNEVKRKINEGTFNATTYKAFVCYSINIKETTKCAVKGVLVCSADCKDVGNHGFSGGKFEVTKEGIIQIGANCSTNCIYFVNGRTETEKTQTKWQDWIVDLPNCGVKDIPISDFMTLDSQIKNVLSMVTINATKGTRGPDLRIQKAFYNPRIIIGDPLYVKLSVKNTGDLEAKLDKINLSVSAKILYCPKTLGAGEESEIIIEAMVEDTANLELELEYRSDKLGCLPTKDFKETFNLGRIEVIKSECRRDSDCPAKELGLEKMSCCNSICKDMAKGFCEDLDGDGMPETWMKY
ncbi:MAG: hypothetical protein KAU95_04555 [Candidatus Aenigmarchaeota archaeon]|nr:hypothetical protein [Candidatus Aenigmarchaeota archaeon]